MGSVRTSILGRPRPLPSDRRAAQPYTLNCEEPIELYPVGLRLARPRADLMFIPVHELAGRTWTIEQELATTPACLCVAGSRERQSHRSTY